jgi:hypothetical protein
VGVWAERVLSAGQFGWFGRSEKRRGV